MPLDAGLPLLARFRDLLVRLIHVLVILLPLVSGSVSAAVVGGLYETSRAVLSESDAERTQAMKDGLAEVLVKLSGDRKVLNNTAVSAILAKPERYIQAFSYETKNRVDPLTGELESTLTLVLRFDAVALNRVLRDAGAPVWGSNRPEVLIWAVQDQTGEREILASDERNSFQKSLVESAASRGLPVLLPLMDLEDASRITASDVWGLFSDPVARASRRYGTEAIVAARVYQQPNGQWRGSWLLLFKDSVESGEAEADSAEAWANLLVDRTADKLSSFYAVVADDFSEGLVDIEIGGIEGLASYAELTRYLQQLVPVQRLKLKSLDGEQMVIRAEIDGLPEQLQELIALDNRLRPVLAESSSYSVVPRIVYRWR